MKKRISTFIVCILVMSVMFCNNYSKVYAFSTSGTITSGSFDVPVRLGDCKNFVVDISIAPHEYWGELHVRVYSNGSSRDYTYTQGNKVIYVNNTSSRYTNAVSFTVHGYIDASYSIFAY